MPETIFPSTTECPHCGAALNARYTQLGTRRLFCGYEQCGCEGAVAEREAIAGARQTIERERPKLNIAAYHRSEDFFELPLLIHSLCKDYALYLRHHPYVPAWDTNLYAR